MADNLKPAPGTIGWVDLTVPNADVVRDFYQSVVGWKVENVPMGDYSDYAMTPPGGGSAVAGVCHASGINAGMPACWMIYVVVKDLDECMARVEAMGGALHGEIRGERGKGRFRVVQDPAGAHVCLYEQPD